MGEKLELNGFGPGGGSGDEAVLLGSGEIILNSCLACAERDLYN
jgi:hypothetical protein